MSISNYLDKKLICFLDEEDRDQALKKLVDTLSKFGKISNKQGFYKAILNREKIVSTGIGMGVAIPHAKMKDFSNFFIAIGIQKEAGLEWNALDKSPVKIIFMIGGPEDKQTEYLQILSRLTYAIKNEDLRKRLLAVDDESRVLELFENF